MKKVSTHHISSKTRFSTSAMSSNFSLNEGSTLSVSAYLGTSVSLSLCLSPFLSLSLSLPSQFAMMLRWSVISSYDGSFSSRSAVRFSLFLLPLSHLFSPPTLTSYTPIETRWYTTCSCPLNTLHPCCAYETDVRLFLV